MSQKELLYLEDAISHEQNVIAYLKDAANNLVDDKLISYIDEEIQKHQNTMKKLVKKLEDNTNE